MVLQHHCLETLKWWIWMFSTVCFLKSLLFLVAMNFPQLYSLNLGGFSSLVNSSNGFTFTWCTGKKKNGIENLSFSLFATTMCSTLSYLSLLQTCIVLDKYWEKVTPISPTCFSFFLNNNNKIQYIRPSYYNTYKKNSNQSQHVMYIIKFIYFVYDFIFLDLVSILLSLSNALDFILYFWGGFELITYNFPMCTNEIEVIWWIIPE